MQFLHNAGLFLYNLTHHQYTVDDINELKANELKDEATKKKVNDFCERNIAWGDAHQRYEAREVQEALKFRVNSLSIYPENPEEYPYYTKLISGGFDEPDSKATGIWQKFLNLIHKNKE